MLSSERITIIVEVNTDDLPGWGNDPQDFVRMIQKLLDDRVPHYNPSVKLQD
jgi:hypothetical protein